MGKGEVLIHLAVPAMVIMVTFAVGIVLLEMTSLIR